MTFLILRICIVVSRYITIQFRRKPSSRVFICNMIWRASEKKPLFPNVLFPSIDNYSLGRICYIRTAAVMLLTSWCRVLREKLTGLQLVKKFPAFHGTRKFITALTSIRHLSLSWASPIQSIYPHSTSWRFILILSTHLRLGFPTGLLPSVMRSKEKGSRYLYESWYQYTKLHSRHTPDIAP